VSSWLCSLLHWSVHFRMKGHRYRFFLIKVKDLAARDILPYSGEAQFKKVLTFNDCQCPSDDMSTTACEQLVLDTGHYLFFVYVYIQWEIAEIAFAQCSQNLNWIKSSQIAGSRFAICQLFGKIGIREITVFNVDGNCLGQRNVAII